MRFYCTVFQFFYCILFSSFQLFNCMTFVGANIEKARKNIEEAMESRRKCFEVAKIRRDQVASKFLKIRDEIDMKKQGGGWIDKASLELETLYKIHGTIYFCSYLFLVFILCSYYCFIIITIISIISSPFFFNLDFYCHS